MMNHFSLPSKPLDSRVLHYDSGVAKLLGGYCAGSSINSHVKEWAYAGFAFIFIGATWNTLQPARHGNARCVPDHIGDLYYAWMKKIRQ